jgi:hypothetical protein
MKATLRMISPLMLSQETAGGMGHGLKNADHQHGAECGGQQRVGGAARWS